MSHASSSVSGSAVASAAEFSHADVLRVISGVVLCILLAALDQTVVIPAVPAIGADLQGYDKLSWIVAAYLIASTVSTPIYGKLSDSFGRRRLLTVCIGLFIVTSVLCALAQSIEQLIWFRALQGLGGGGLMALAQAAIADVAPPRERGRYQGYLSAVWAIASISGPLVGGFVAEHWSWRWIFWMNLPLGAAAMWACHRGLRRIQPPAHAVKPRIDYVGMALLTAAISTLLVGLGEGGHEFAWISKEFLGVIMLGGFLLFALVLQERRTADPVLPPAVFANASYVASVLISTLAAVVLFICLFTIPLYFQLARGSTAAASGLFVAPFMLANVAGNLLGSRYARRHGTMRGALRMATATSCVGLILLSMLSVNAPAWLTIIAMVITAPGVGVCLLGTIMSAQNAVQPRDIGAGTGALLVLRSVGGAVGSTLAGAVLAIGAGSMHGLAEHSEELVVASGQNVSGSFSMIYAIAAGIFFGAFLVTLFMPNTPLRGRPAPQVLGE